jgi:hypothetical protein
MIPGRGQFPSPVERFWNASTLVGAPEGAGNFKIPCAVNEYLLAAEGRAVGVMNPPGRILAEWNDL